MLGLRRTPEGLRTDLRPKNDQTRGYSGVGRQGRMFLLRYSPEVQKLLMNNSGLLATESTSPTIAFNRQKRSWNLSISIASDPTHSWILLWSQVFAGRSYITRWPQHYRSVGGRSQVYHGDRAVVVILGPEFMPIDLRMACGGRELASLTWCDRNSLLLLGQLDTLLLTRLV